MNLQAAFQISLLLSNFLCTTAFGFLLIFSIVIMPGISQLSDANFLRAFQVIDGVIQQNQPIFVLTWICSFLVLLLTSGLAFASQASVSKASTTHIFVAAILYVVGQIITVTANIPRNNRIKTLNTNELEEDSLAFEREYFEGPWRKWNTARVVLFMVTSVLLWVSLLQEESVVGTEKRGSANRSLIEQSQLQASYC
jgi:uncharacterized membrane protein